MSLVYFKTLIKRNWLLLVIFIAVLTMYMGVMISMYDPEDMEALATMTEMFPPEMMNAMGFSSLVTDMTGFLASWLYGLLMLGFPLVYCIILGNRLVAKMVDNSSFAYLLSTPNSRIKLIVTSGVYALLSILVLFSCLFLIGVALCEITFPGLLDVGAFFKLNVTTMLVNMAVMMISFFFSCLFNETRLSLSFGAGIPILFLLMNMLGGVTTDMNILKSVSIYGFYDPVELVQGADILPTNLGYAAVSIALLAAGVYIFNRKRLPL